MLAVSEHDRNPPSRKRRLAFVLLLPFFAAASWGIGTFAANRTSKNVPSPDVVKPADGLVIDAKWLDVGEQWETEEFVCRLPIHNPTSAAIAIANLTPGCNCSSIAPRQLTIAAGDTAEVEMKIDLTHRVPSEMGLSERAFFVEIVPTLNSPAKRPPTWILRGIVRSRVTLDHDFLQFGDSPIHGQTMTRRLVAKAHVPTERLEIRADAKLIGVQVQRQGEAQFVVSVSPIPNLPPGTFKTELGIDVVAPDGSRLPDITLPVAGTVQPAVRLLPARVFLGSHAIGQTASAIVVMQIPAGVTAKVDRIETDSADVTVSATEVKGIESGRAFCFWLGAIGWGAGP